MTDSSGGAAKRFDYLPFGGDLLATIDGRTTGAGYYSSPSGVNPEFTGKNRDTESALDWFEIRYMSANQGRFQSPDPDNAGANPADPQTWNAYSYVGNNPLSMTDPSGEGVFGMLFGTLGTIFGGPWGGAAGFAVGNGLDAKIWGPKAIGLPGLTLGSLAGIGNSPGIWNEQIPGGAGAGPLNTGGVFGGGDAGLGIKNLSPDGHWEVTFKSAISAGYGFFAAWQFASGVALVDRGTQGKEPQFTHIHAMGAASEDCGQAYANVARDLDANLLLADGGDKAAAYRAGHTIEDSYVHRYADWNGGGFGGWPGLIHVGRDFESASETNRSATTSFLTDLKNRRLHNAASYLAPRSSCRGR